MSAGSENSNFQQRVIIKCYDQLYLLLLFSYDGKRQKNRQTHHLSAIYGHAASGLYIYLRYITICVNVSLIGLYISILLLPLNRFYPLVTFCTSVFISKRYRYNMFLVQGIIYYRYYCFSSTLLL